MYEEVEIRVHIYLSFLPSLSPGKNLYRLARSISLILVVMIVHTKDSIVFLSYCIAIVISADTEGYDG